MSYEDEIARLRAHIQDQAYEIERMRQDDKRLESTDWQQKLDAIEKAGALSIAEAEGRLAATRKVLNWTKGELDRVLAQLGRAEHRLRLAQRARNGLDARLMKAEAVEADWRQALDD